MNKAYRAWILGLVVLAQFSLVACNKADEAAASLNNQQSVSKEVVDSQVTVNVKQALAADKKTQSLPVTVVTLKGDVKLSGAVDQQSQITTSRVWFAACRACTAFTMNCVLSSRDQP
jgi:predicted component of type VI protein secretion system